MFMPFDPRRPNTSDDHRELLRILSAEGLPWSDSRSLERVLEALVRMGEDAEPDELSDLASSLDTVFFSALESREDWPAAAVEALARFLGSAGAPIAFQAARLMAARSERVLPVLHLLIRGLAAEQRRAEVAHVHEASERVLRWAASRARPALLEALTWPAERYAAEVRHGPGLMRDRGDRAMPLGDFRVAVIELLMVCPPAELTSLVLDLQMMAARGEPGMEPLVGYALTRCPDTYDPGEKLLIRNLIEGSREARIESALLIARSWTPRTRRFSTEVAQALEDALEDPDRGVRLRAIHRVAELGSVGLSTIRPLCRQLAEGDRELRASAYQALEGLLRDLVFSISSLPKQLESGEVFLESEMMGRHLEKSQEELRTNLLDLVADQDESVACDAAAFLRALAEKQILVPRLSGEDRRRLQESARRPRVAELLAPLLRHDS